RTAWPKVAPTRSSSTTKRSTAFWRRPSAARAARTSTASRRRAPPKSQPASARLARSLGRHAADVGRAESGGQIGGFAELEVDDFHVLRLRAGAHRPKRTAGRAGKCVRIDEARRARARFRIPFVVRVLVDDREELAVRRQTVRRTTEDLRLGPSLG